MSKDIDELVDWQDTCGALAASLQRKIRHCDEITEERNQMERERDSFKRQLAGLQDAILLALVQRIEPRISRHPVTVVQHAGSVIARVGEAIGCQFEDGDDLVAAVKELVRERDEARAEVKRLKAHHLERHLESWEQHMQDNDVKRAYRRGAEAMREACAVAGQEACRNYIACGEVVAETLRALPVPEEATDET